MPAVLLLFLGLAGFCAWGPYPFRLSGCSRKGVRPNPKKLEIGFRTHRAGVLFALLFRIEASKCPTFGLLLCEKYSDSGSGLWDGRAFGIGALGFRD